MIVRVLVGVVLAGALLAAATPGIHAARADRGAHLGATETARLADATDALVARNDPAPVGVNGATARVHVRLPSASLTLPPVAVFFAPATDARNALVGYRVAGESHAKPLPVSLPVTTEPAGERLVVRAGGRATFVLRYTTTPAGPVVRVTRESK